MKYVNTLLETLRDWWSRIGPGEVTLTRDGVSRITDNMPLDALCNVDLRGAYLTGDDLRNVALCNADIRGVYLTGADLRTGYVDGADLRESKGD